MQQSSSDQPVISTTTGNPGGNAGAGNNGSGSQAVVHVRGDSETELDLLFSVLRNGDQKSSYRNKNLPLSFFQPPEKKPTHSREGSHDLSAYASSGAPGVFHSRSHSSPAQLPLTMSLAPPMGVQMGQHTKQGSLEMAIPDSSMNALHISQQQQQLPQQWNINAGKYPFNNPPNAGGVSGNGWTGGVPQKHPQQQQQQQQQQQLTGMDLGPLPKGWEQGMTAEGDIYYIDHHNKRTSWTDPRTLKKNTPVKPRQGQPVHPGKPQIQHPGLLTQQQQHQLANQRMGAAVAGQLPPKSGSSVPRPKLKQGLVNQGLQLTPQQQQQLLGGQQQQQQQQQQSCIMPFPTTAAAADHLLKELEHLRKEKERLAREQEEYDRREQQLMLELRNQQLQHQLNNNNNNNSNPGNNNNSQINKGLQQQQQQQQMLHQMANAADFCLGGTNGLLNQSGSNNVNLANVNGVLVNAGNGLGLLGGGGSGQGGVNSPLDISDLTQLASLDVPSMLDSDQAPMESDDLISSLNDAMSSDLMLMDMQMIDTLL